MNILIPNSWLREFLETNATPQEIQKAVSLCGQSIERLKEVNGEWIYDVEVTTNRVDCMSVIGIAREALAALTRFNHTAKLKKDPFKKLKYPSVSKVSYLDVTLEPDLCSNFSAVLIKNVKVKPSPEWIVKKLESVGMRSLNNIVDVSNLLMHELGQPIHTFDYDKIEGHSLHMRLSSAGETVTTLDNQTFELSGGDIVMCDASGKIIDLCGIMGGSNSAVSDDTKNILLFVQTYNPTLIRKTSMTTGLRTNAAVLFEKGLPTESVLPTLYSASKLIKTLAGGSVSTEVLSISDADLNEKILNLMHPLTPFVSKILGVPITAAQTRSILQNLGFKIISDKKITIPWFRKCDIESREDLVEEIARIYGYHNLPSVLMAGNLPLSRPLDSDYYWEREIRRALKYYGFTETYTYSLTPSDTGLKLKNPLSSEWTFLRTNLTNSHLQIISENIGRVPELNFFEIAKVYTPDQNSLPKESQHLIISTTNSNYRQLKGTIESIFTLLGTETGGDIIRYSNPECLIFEIPLENYLKLATSIKKFTPVSKFAPVIEDVNITYSGNYADLENKIKLVSPLIKKIELIDIYESKIALRITYLAADEQLSKDDIAPIREKLTSINNLH